MILMWNEETCLDLIIKLARELEYTEIVEQVKWLTRVAYSDSEDTELRLAAKLCSAERDVVIRVDSDNQCHIEERLQFQKILHQNQICVPKILKVIKTDLSEHLKITAYLEEWIGGLSLSSADFSKYAEYLGLLHAVCKNIESPFSSQRNHVLFDTDRIAIEMRSRLLCDTSEKEMLIQKISTLMIETKKHMEQMKRYPVHGDYSTDNLIKTANALCMVDFGWSGNGYLPEEAGEAFAEIECSCFSFRYWDERLEEFLSIYSSYAKPTEQELSMIEAVALISLVIRVLQKEPNDKQRFVLCRSILDKERRIWSC